MGPDSKTQSEASNKNQEVNDTTVDIMIMDHVTMMKKLTVLNL